MVAALSWSMTMDQHTVCAGNGRVPIGSAGPGCPTGGAGIRAKHATALFSAVRLDWAAPKLWTGQKRGAVRLRRSGEPTPRKVGVSAEGFALAGGADALNRYERG